MGFWGWKELKDWVTMVGVVDAATGQVGSSDGDWCIKVKPEPPYQDLLTSRPGDINRTNDNGLVECEVQPPGFINTAANAQSQWGPLVGQRVVVIGTHVIDSSHYARGGGSIVKPWEADQGKLEIHPITVLFADPDDNPSNAPALSKQVPVWCVSDSADSSIFDPQRPSTCPHNKENRVTDFVIPFPPVPAGVAPERWHTWRMLSEDNRARAFSARLLPPGQAAPWSAGIVCHVETGQKNEGKGWYHSVIELGTPALFVKQDVPSAMQAGKTYPVSITMRNLDRNPWADGALTRVQLGAQSPQDNASWGLNRVPLPAPTPMNSEVTFQFTVTAPKSNGNYPFSWQLVFETILPPPLPLHFAFWRGEVTPPVTVTVTGAKGKESKEGKEGKDHKEGKEHGGKEALLEKAALRESQRTNELLVHAAGPPPEAVGAGTPERASADAGRVFITLEERPATDPQDPSRLVPAGSGDGM